MQHAGAMHTATDRTAIKQFIDYVAADATHHARLGGIESPDTYVRAVVDLAATMGAALSTDAVHDAMRGGSSGSGGDRAAPIARDDWPPPGWLPTRSVSGAASPAIDWAWFGDRPLAEPFYEDSVRSVASRPFNRMFRTRTTLAALVDGMPADAVVPDGFIFHLSRCGSTLATQMLAAVPHHRVASEAEPIDAVVRWAVATDAPMPERVAALRAIVGAIGRHRAGGPRRFFIKLDCWHATALPLFRAAFPATSWIFLYRDPTEIMVSQMRLRGLHTVPGMVPTQALAIPGGESMRPGEYCAKALAGIAKAALDHRSLGDGMPVRYDTLADAMRAQIPAHFGFTPTPQEADAMENARGHDAKDPLHRFVPDGKEKQNAASDAVRAAVDLHLSSIFGELEQWRTRRTD